MDGDLRVRVKWFALQLLELSGALLSICIPYKEREVSCKAWVEGENSVEGGSDVHTLYMGRAESQSGLSGENAQGHRSASIWPSLPDSLFPARCSLLAHF